MSNREILSDLARVKALFQLRAIATVMGLPVHPAASTITPAGTANGATVVDADKLPEVSR